MIVITGAAGFIGNSMVRHLNESGRSDLVLVDDFTPIPVETCHGVSDIFPCNDVETCHDEVKNSPNIPVETFHGASLHCEDTFLQGVKYTERVPRNLFFDWLNQNPSKIDFIIHLGAEIDTLPEYTACFHEYILEFSQRLWSFAAMNRIPLLFAASSVDNAWEQLAWLKGDEKAYDRERRRECETYKQTFDRWVLKQRITPPLWTGFSMAEVYGPGEYNKGSDASSVMRILHQIHQHGNVVIPCLCVMEMAEEEIFTDRIFINDVVTVITWFMNHLPASGFYQLATGYPRPLSAVAKTVFSVLRKEEKIDFVPVPESKDKIPYQKMDLPLNSLRRVGYKKNFTPLEKGIRIFVREFLKK